MLKKLMKEIRRVMSNTSDVINAVRDALIDISNDSNSKTMLSNLFIGTGVGLSIIGVLIRLS